MIPRNKRKINLEWFILTQESSLKYFAIGRGGLGRLKKNLIELYSFKRPKIEIQNQIVDEYNKIITLKEKLDVITQRLDKQFEKIVVPS
jgi:restriction endonuclease S subunit